MRLIICKPKINRLIRHYQQKGSFLRAVKLSRVGISSQSLIKRLQTLWCPIPHQELRRWRPQRTTIRACSSAYNEWKGVWIVWVRLLRRVQQIMKILVLQINKTRGQRKASQKRNYSLSNRYRELSLIVALRQGRHPDRPQSHQVGAGRQAKSTLWARCINGASVWQPSLVLIPLRWTKLIIRESKSMMKILMPLQSSTNLKKSLVKSSAQASCRLSKWTVVLMKVIALRWSWLQTMECRTPITKEPQKWTPQKVIWTISLITIDSRGTP